MNITVTEDEKDTIIQALKVLAEQKLRYAKNLGTDDVQQIFRKQAISIQTLKLRLETE